MAFRILFLFIALIIAPKIAFAEGFNWKRVYGKYTGVFPLCNHYFGTVYGKDARIEFGNFLDKWGRRSPTFRLAIFHLDRRLWIGVQGSGLSFDPVTGYIQWSSGGPLSAGDRVVDVTIGAGGGPGFYIIGGHEPQGDFVRGKFVGRSIDNFDRVCGPMRFRRIDE